VEMFIPVRFAEKRIYHDYRIDALFDSNHRILSSHPTVRIFASLHSYQSRSQSVA
jgi:hypothetical protein